jgi:chaperonin GroES
MKIRPLSDRIVLRRKVAADKVGSIFVPENAKEKLSEGEVLAVGPGQFVAELNERRPVAVKAGDVVVFGKYSGAEVEVDGDKIVVLREDDILGVLDLP